MVANSGRAPKAWNVTHWLVPLRQAVEVACCPSLSGPTVRVPVAIPFALVATAVLPAVVIPAAVCQVTDWPAAGAPLLSTRTCVVHEMVAPAARERVGARAVRTGGAPPLKCACRLEPLVSEAMTTDAVPSIAVMVMVALPYPVAVT